MSNWAEIKAFVNSDLGKENFLSIDELIMLSKEYIIPVGYNGTSANLSNPIVSWSSESPPTQNIKFRSYANGYVVMNLVFRRSYAVDLVPSIFVYHGENLVKELSGDISAENITFKIFKGDTLTIKFENASGYAKGGTIKIFGELVDHYGLREVN